MSWAGSFSVGHEDTKGFRLACKRQIDEQKQIKGLTTATAVPLFPHLSIFSYELSTKGERIPSCPGVFVAQFERTSLLAEPLQFHEKTSILHDIDSSTRKPLSSSIIPDAELKPN